MNKKSTNTSTKNAYDDKSCQKNNPEQDNVTFHTYMIDVRKFYMQLTRYVCLNIFGIFIWMLNGGGYFWPVWPILLWGADMLYQAHTLNLLKDKQKYADKIMSYAKQWEEEQMQKLKKAHEEKHSANSAQKENKNEIH